MPLRRLAFALIPLLLLGAAACDDSNSASPAEPTATAEEPQPTAEESQPTAKPTDAVEPQATDEESSGRSSPPGSAAGTDLFGSISPFQLLDTFGNAPPSENVDPELKSGLLTADDLPGDYQALGEFGSSVPSEYGPIEMAASIFTNGDMESQDLADMGGMVVSAAMNLPPEALAELGDIGDLGNAALEDVRSQEMEGFLSELTALDASGLGDGGFGIRMVMDLGALAGLFGGAPEEELPFDGIAIEMYGFVEGEQLLMVMVMAPLGGAQGVDARDLAETMDARSG